MANTVRASDVASMFLRAIGAPDTTSMRRAVSVWLRWESGGTITGNNPWNLHSGPNCTAEKRYCPGQGSLPGQIGNRYAGTGDRNVAVFDTLEHGVQANARNLINLAPSYGYGKVLEEARSGDALGFLTALQNSSWSAGHYGYSKLVNAFNSAFDYSGATLNLNAVGGQQTGQPLTFWKGVNGGPGITFPVGHKLTAANVDSIIAYLKQWQILKDDWAGLGEVGVRSLLTAFIGREWNESLAFDIQRGLSQGGEQIADAFNPVDEAGDVLAAVGRALAFILDPENWLYIIALLGGGMLAAYGFAQLTGVRVPFPKPPGVPSTTTGVGE